MTPKPFQPLLGAHMSIAGGVHNAVAHAVRAGCNALQIFLKNGSQWHGKPIAQHDRQLFRKALEESGIEALVAHASYLVNAASPDAGLRRKSVTALVDELERANLLGVGGLILHPGAHMGDGVVAGIRRVAESLDQAFGQVSPPARILLETTAGQGTSLGHSFEQLAAILERVRDNGRIGFCIDTCHIFAAGYDIRSEDGYRKTMRRFSSLIGRDRIESFHVNDCRRDLGARVDRHTHIGKGFIGLEAFRCLMNDPRFLRVPKILETPKGPDLAEDIENLAVLRGLYKHRSRKLRASRR